MELGASKDLRASQSWLIVKSGHHVIGPFGGGGRNAWPLAQRV